MSALQWDRIDERTFEAGVDRGVLYLPDGGGVPWNGLISVNESFTDTTEPFYLDGFKYVDRLSIGDFAAKLEAITYPDEFLQFDGVDELAPGLFIENQNPKRFHLSYRTRVGNAIDGVDYGYKIHILYNLTAVPSAKQYGTLTDQVSLTTFSWDISSVPVRVSGFRPTAHFILDSTKLNWFMLRDLETVLYGSNDSILDGGTVESSGLDLVDGGGVQSLSDDYADGGTPYFSDIGSANGGEPDDPDDGFVLDGGEITELDLELIDGGGVTSVPNNAYLPPIDELIRTVTSWELITVTDHGDGTATISGPDELVYEISPGEFRIDGVDITSMPDDELILHTTTS